MTTMDYPDPMHEASYKIHSEIFGLATTAVEWILSVMHSHYSTPLPILLEKQGKINNKQVWGLWADNHQIWLGGEGELGIYEKGKKTQKLLFTRMPAAPTNTYQCDLPRQTRTTVARHL